MVDSFEFCSIYFSDLQSLLASVGVILALVCQPITSEITYIYHEDAT